MRPTPIHGKRAAAAGFTLVPLLAVIALLLVLGLSLVTTTQVHFAGAGAHRDMTEARYLAEASLRTIVARQNDQTKSPRYFFDPTTYQTTGADPRLLDLAVADPESGQTLGTVTRAMVGGKNPFLDPPPYRVRSTSSVRGAVRTFEAEVAPLSLLEYALWTESSVSIAPYITYSGKVYSATSIDLTGAPITFRKKVEYVTTIYNSGYGTYNEGKVQLAVPRPSLTSLVNLAFYQSAAQAKDVCDEGYGLYLSTGLAHTAAFQRSGGGYQIDLTLFDFTGPRSSPPAAIRYNGVDLYRYDDATKPILEFNGIIYVDGTLYIWGSNGGRSVEDVAWRDDLTGNPVGKQYEGPAGKGKNWYSNNRIDAGEDGTGGGSINSILDPRKLGRSLTIVTRSGSDIYLEHNIFMGQDPDGIPVRTALISGRALHVSANAPKTLIIEAALMGLGGSTCSGSSSSNTWLPCGDHGAHADNWWARVPGTSPAAYTYDVSHNGLLEANNGAYWSYDRDEGSMLSAWSLQVLGNRVFWGVPSSGHWASDSHLRFYTYDPTLVIYEPPCYPVLPEYDLVPGTVSEVR